MLNANFSISISLEIFLRDLSLLKTKEYKWNVCFYWHIVWAGGWVCLCEDLHFKDVKCAYKCSAMLFQLLKTAQLQTWNWRLRNIKKYDWMGYCPFLSQFFLKEKNKFCMINLYLWIKMGVLLKSAMSMKAHWLYIFIEKFISFTTICGYCDRHI